MPGPTKRTIIRALERIGIRETPNADGLRWIRRNARRHEIRAAELHGIAAHLEAALAGAHGPITIHSISDEAEYATHPPLS